MIFFCVLDVTLAGLALEPDPLNLLYRNVIRRSVVEFCSSRRLMGGDVSGGFQRSAIFQIDRDPGRPEAVVAYLSE
jgi:hypothetical protein